MTRVAIGLGSLRVCWPRFFKFRAWSWVLWSWVPDCKLTSPGSWWPALFGLECLDSGLLSWLSGWNGFASGFSGLCPHSGLVFSVARLPGSSPLVGLGFADSWDVGWISDPLIVVILSEVRLFGLRSILRTMMGMSVRHDWSHSQSGDMHFTDLASMLVVFLGRSMVI